MDLSGEKMITTIIMHNQESHWKRNTEKTITNKKKKHIKYPVQRRATNPTHSNPAARSSTGATGNLKSLKLLCLLQQLYLPGSKTWLPTPTLTRCVAFR